MTTQVDFSSVRSLWIRFCLGTSLVLLGTAPGGQAAEDSQALAEAYVKDIRNIVSRYCHSCHSARRTEADIDLEAIRTPSQVRRAVKVWQKASEMLESGQMPPQGARQPTETERASLRTWVRATLKAEARTRLGDPGPVVLRRLSNAEYTYTLRDLTGVDSLEPAREFPVDGAAGEGFTNTGNALVMSPGLLTKYLEAAKSVASHATLLPDGIRFIAGTTRRDAADVLMNEIRQFYAEYADPEGKIPLASYLAALLEDREALAAKTTTLDNVATKRRLNPRYLKRIAEVLQEGPSSPLLDPIRARFRLAKPQDAGPLAAEVARWQATLARFRNVGHMGAWIEPMTPVTAVQELRVPIPANLPGKEVTLTLTVGDAGQGHEGDIVVWQQPRLVTPGRAPLQLRDVESVTQQLATKRSQLFASAARCLKAAAEVRGSSTPTDMAQVAERYGVPVDTLRAWFDYLGIGSGVVTLTGHMTQKIAKSAGYDFVQGWGTPETPNLVANASDQQVRIPGIMKPHSVAVHPSPTLRAAVAWRSPMAGALRVEAKITHAHPECGNGVAWILELRRGAARQRLAGGVAQGSKPVSAGPLENIAVEIGDVIILLIDPREGNHACDLTTVDLNVTALGVQGKVWDLARDVSGNVSAGNPHADRWGNEAVWHFLTEPVNGSGLTPVIPAGSLLAKWQAEARPEERGKLADAVQRLLTEGPAVANSPDAALHAQLSSLGGPLLRARATSTPREGEKTTPRQASPWGLDPALFGRVPGGGAVDPQHLCVQGPSSIRIRLPADLVAGSEFQTTAILHLQRGQEGCVQVQAVLGDPGPLQGARPGLPFLVASGSESRKRLLAAMDHFREIFPPALCYPRIVPVDEVVTLRLFHREDEPLTRLMLDDQAKSRIDRLWRDLHFVSHDALTSVDAYAQLMEYATQDSDPRKFEHLRKPIQERAVAFRKELLDAEPRHVEAVLEFAQKAHRRPLTAQEGTELRTLYKRLRSEDLPHEEAVRLTLARVLTAPTFLYRMETPPPGPRQGPVNSHELAVRLSYFLTSSLPDAPLQSLATSGQLRDPDVLVAQGKRLLRDPRVRRMALEFACQWLNVRDLDELNEKSERHFPTFVSLRGAMLEETTRFFTDLFQRDGTVREILDSDHTFLNEALARHYGIPGVTGPEWRRVEGIKALGRGGILAQASTLARQSGASRTSPILRGNWISEALLGERLPRPPKDVPRLPEDETATEGLTVRQLVEKHSSDPKCAICHRRIDPYGFSLERFDAIGRLRDRDLAGRPIDTRTKTMDGKALDGLPGLRSYLIETRGEAFRRHFCRKLLGYALGRGVQLSDEPLLDAMEEALHRQGDRISAAIETILRSQPFREIRGRDAAAED